jgi:hypothetical protein
MAHWMNLAAKDIADGNPMLEKIQVILRWFGANHKAHAGLRAKGVPLPPTATETRWSSQSKLVEYYNRHWGALTDVCATVLRPGDQVRRDLENTQVRRASEDLAMQLRPITDNLMFTQSDGYTLADCTANWLDIVSRFPQQFKANYKMVLDIPFFFC